MRYTPAEAYTQTLYTADEILGLHLPGFQYEASLWDMAAPNTDWQHVMSLSVYSLDSNKPGELNVLTGIRTEDTATHANVASTPTSRFPAEFAQPLLTNKSAHSQETYSVDLPVLDARNPQVAAVYYPNRQDVPNRSAPFPNLSHEMLVTKVGIDATALRHTENSRPLGTLSLSHVIAGFSYAAYDKAADTPLWEPVMLYAGAFFLHKSAAMSVPSVAYRSRGWTTTGDFLEGVTEHRISGAKTPLQKLIPTISPADEATVCKYGLCLDATRLVTRDPRRLAGHLGILWHNESGFSL